MLELPGASAFESCGPVHSHRGLGDRDYFRAIDRNPLAIQRRRSAGEKNVLAEAIEERGEIAVAGSSTMSATPIRMTLPFAICAI